MTGNISRKISDRGRSKREGRAFAPHTKVCSPPFQLAYKKRLYSPNRVLYPLKRVDWDPKGDRHPENRGKSGYVRISWDEALDIIADEIRRILDKYGPYAILTQADGHAQTKAVHGPHAHPTHLLLEELGGCIYQIRNPDSWEGWYWGAFNVWGFHPPNCGTQNVQNAIPDVCQNTELLLFWGCDPESTTWGWQGQLPSRLCFFFKELGIKRIFISPDLNFGAAVHADKWIPIKPNTDAALQLAIAYLWITEDRYDKEYVKTHTYGFENFKKYVLGEEDGIPKTPRWAEGITGVPARVIKALAREWASKRTTIVHIFGGGYIRGPYSHEPARLEVLLLAMQGWGKPGVHQLHFPGSYLFQARELNPWPQAETVPSLIHINAEPLLFPVLPDKQFVPKTLVPDAILNPPVEWVGRHLVDPPEFMFKKFKFPEDGFPEIHMIWTDSPCWTTCWNNGFRYIEAIRSPKIEFVLAQHMSFENDCNFADIVLPVTTKLEEEDIGNDILNGQFCIIQYEEKAVEPLGESKTDYEIVCMIAKRLEEKYPEKFKGLYGRFTYGETVEDKMKRGFEGSGCSKYLTWEELKEKKYFVVPTHLKWEDYEVFPPGARKFYEDPEKNPLKTPSGKIEFFSQNLAKYFPDDQERLPVPHFISYGESHQESLLHPRAKKYPLLVVSPHGRWRMHAQLDDFDWFHEIPTSKIRGPDGYLYEPVWIHPVDAEKRGIRYGDVIKMYNERGAVLGAAYVTERIMPGVVRMDHGSRVDLVDDKLDRGGAINLITPSKTTSKNNVGMAVSGFLVEVEKVSLDELRAKYPEIFLKPYHPESGLTLEKVLVKMGR